MQESCRVTIRCEYFKSSFQELQPVWSSGGWAAVPPIPSWLLGLLALAAEPDSAGDSDRKTHTWLGCTMGIPVQMTQSAADTHLQARATPAPQIAKAVLFFHGAPDLKQRETAPRALGRFSCSHLSANQVANETTCTDASDPLHGLLLAFL